jgi:MerR family transcriptional regulator, light-induced transcriptional regulator
VPQGRIKTAQTVPEAADRDLSPRQVAEAIGVSESSLKRWCDSGAIPTRRTAGGHRRVPVAGVVAFLRERGFDPERPDLLGLPAGAHRDRRELGELAGRAGEALRTGDESELSALLLGLYLGGRSLAELADKILAPAFVSLGTSWAHGQIEVYQERRAVELVRKTLHELSRVLPPPAANAPLALTATLEGDPYTLPVAVAELVLCDAGWRATSLGSGNPAASLCAAIDHLSPRLLCVSASAIGDDATFTIDCNVLYEHAHSRGAALALGGRALTRELRERIRYSAYCESMLALVGFAESLWTKP